MTHQGRSGTRRWLALQLLLSAGGMSLGALSPAGASEAPVAPPSADARAAIAGVTAANLNAPSTPSFDADTGDDEAPPRVSFGRALDLEGTPISLVTKTTRATGLRFSPGRNNGPAVMPSGSPLRFGSISSGYGSRWHPIYGVVRFHAGIDMAAPSGTPVYATSSGVILVAGSCGGYGQCVAIDHGGGVVSVYGHLSKIEAYTGQKIANGQELGLVGSTGLSTGPHLHYEIRINGKPINPRPYI